MEMHLREKSIVLAFSMNTHARTLCARATVELDEVLLRVYVYNLLV